MLVLENMIKLYEKKCDIDTKNFGRVAVLCGGNSAEREVSLRSGDAVFRALVNAKVDVIKLDVREQVVKQILAAKIDRVFIALHGVGGEDGKIQALLDLLNIPYTGSDHASSAIAMNKLKAKQVWQTVDIATPKYVVLNERSDWEGVITDLGDSIFVKPVLEGSSLGMSHIHTALDLQAAYFSAAEHNCQVIAEQAIAGREFTVAILNGVALPPIELKTDHDFYDYDAKYIASSTQYICPTDLTEEKVECLKTISLRAFDEIGCSGWGRADFMQDQDGHFYLLELNTVPGMTDHSLVPMAAKAAGLSFEELILEILSQAV